MTTDNSFNLYEVVAIACSVIDNDGEFKGNSNTGYAGDTPGYVSTKDKVLKFLNKQEGPEVTEAHKAKAMTVIEYFKGIKDKRPSLTDFLLELYNMAKSNDSKIPQNRVGYAVAMVPTFDKYMKDEEFLKNSDYVGVVGTRMNLFIKLIEKKYISGAECYLYTFIDRRQNVVKAWMQNDKDERLNLNLGDCIDLDAYINKHEANKYNQVRETFINRIKIIDNKGKA
tara:strand:- start:175 stop:852 length:678 start_codon:yes stop_codon:yes gene_type:complete